MAICVESATRLLPSCSTTHCKMMSPRRSACLFWCNIAINDTFQFCRHTCPHQSCTSAQGMCQQEHSDEFGKVVAVLLRGAPRSAAFCSRNALVQPHPLLMLLDCRRFARNACLGASLHVTTASKPGVWCGIANQETPAKLQQPMFT